MKDRADFDEQSSAAVSEQALTSQSGSPTPKSSVSFANRIRHEISRVSLSS